ncbi:MAG: PspC domain-containing protein [Bacteroidota bacterium]
MARERYRRRSSIAEEFDTSLMYDDIEKIREREEEEEKDQNTKLGSAGMMALIAGAGLMLATVFGGQLDFIRDFWEVIVPVLSVIGYGALGYGFYKTMKLAFRQKELNFPALNVYRKTKPVPPPVKEERTRARTRNRNTERQRGNYEYTRRARTYSRPSQQRGLRRSRTNRVFSGVAGGIAEYFGISPALIRFGFVASLFPSGGASIFLYLLLSIVLPANYDTFEDIDRKARRNPSPGERM